MDGETIMVSIFDADQAIEARPCRLVHLPDGTRAALWRGLAWPVGSDDRIDIAGPAYPLLEGPPTPEPLFGIVDGTDEAWLVLDGTVALRDTVAGELREAGIEVLRSGPWLGDPVDGVAGSGFIRFVRPNAGDLRQTIGAILGGKIAAAAPEPEPAERVRALTVELIEARAALARVSPPLQTKQPNLANAEIENELDRLQRENNALIQEVAELRSELTAAQSARPQPGRPAGGRVQEEIAKVVAGLRPDLHFLRDSMTVLWGEFSDRGGLCRALHELGSGSMTGNWKRIQGAPGWWERRVSNGQDDSGRIYARPRQGRCDVLVSHKAQQGRDISWLARQAI